MANTNLHAAKNAKNDEFYTQLTDIEKEVRHYKEQFKDKVVLCNCDDPEWSNFWMFFSKQFENYGLKGLISTHYDAAQPSYMLEMKRLDDGSVVTEKTALTQNGDFRSPECVALLDRADIVVTNPPFSLFREYVALLEEHHAKYLIIGSMNAITYKEIFPLIKNNKLWLGYNMVKEFAQPDGTTKKFGNINWYTNLDIAKRHEKLPLWETYSAEKFPKYDNYDAIEVAKTADIPADWSGAMGVPITFLDKYCPEQFEILGLLQSSTDEEAGTPNLRYYNDFVEMKQDMTRTGAKGGKANGNPVVAGKSEKGNFLFNPATGEYVHSVYARILIRRKQEA